MGVSVQHTRSVVCLGPRPAAVVVQVECLFELQHLDVLDRFKQTRACESLRVGLDDVIVVPKDKVLAPVELFQDFDDTLVLCEREIPDVPHNVSGAYHCIPVVDERLVHFLHVLVRAVAVLDDGFVPEVRVGGEEHVYPTIYTEPVYGQGMIKTGLKTLDEEISLEPGATSLTYLISPAGNGKTTTLASIALNTLLAGHDVLYLSGDASAKHIVEKVQRFSTGLPVTGTPGQLKVIDDPLYPSNICRHIRESNRDNTLVIVDHFNGIIFDDITRTPEELFRVLRTLDVPVIMGFQCSRDAYGRWAMQGHPEYFMYLDHVFYMAKTYSLLKDPPEFQADLLYLKSRDVVVFQRLQVELGPNGLIQV